MAGRSELEKRLGERLRDVRLGERLTQQELADRANVSVGALKHLENGQGATVGTFVRVLSALGRFDLIDQLSPPAPTFSPLALLQAQQLEQQRPARRVRRKISA